MEFDDIADEPDRGFLDGHMLIAMPGIGDTRFERTVIALAMHSPRGAVGFVVNRPSDVPIGTLFERLGIDEEPDEGGVQSRRAVGEVPVMQGGPVEGSRGFVLHSADFGSRSTFRFAEDMALTSTLDVLRAIAHGRGPRHAALMLGYAAWGEGQLENELKENVWLTSDADSSIVFGSAVDERYAAALGRMGVAPEALSGMAGNA